MKSSKTLKPEWHIDETVRAYECGPDGRARVSALCDLMQECAGRHADHLGIGVERLQTQGMIWALARIGLEIEQVPGNSDALRIETWLHGSRGPYALREFCILDTRGEAIARASYAWIPLEYPAKKPIRPDIVLDGLPSTPDRVSLDARLGKIRPFEHACELSPVYTRPGDIDVQKHINNTRYISWIEDALEEMEPAGSRYRIAKLQVNFIDEAASWQRIEVTGGKPGQGADSGERTVFLSIQGNDIVRAKAVLVK